MISEAQLEEWRKLATQQSYSPQTGMTGMIMLRLINEVQDLESENRRLQHHIAILEDEAETQAQEASWWQRKQEEDGADLLKKLVDERRRAKELEIALKMVQG